MARDTEWGWGLGCMWQFKDGKQTYVFHAETISGKEEASTGKQCLLFPPKRWQFSAGSRGSGKWETEMENEAWWDGRRKAQAQDQERIWCQ